MADAVPNNPDDVKPADAGKTPGAPPAPVNDSKPPEPQKTEAAASPTAFVVKSTVAESAETSAFPRKLSFNARRTLIESREAYVFPRADIKDNGFEKVLRFLGMGDIVDATRQPKNKGHLISQEIATKIGFGEIFRAARQPHGKVRGTLKAIGTKIADMAAGRMVSGSFKLIAITFVAGIIGGVSGWGTICLLGLATGASSAIYTYGKNYISDKLSLPKSQRSKVKLIDKTRALDALKAFGSGLFNGVFGAWLAKLPIFNSAMKFLHDTIHQGLNQIPFSDDSSKNFSAFGRSITAPFNGAASFPAIVPDTPAPRLRLQPAFG